MPNVAKSATLLPGLMKMKMMIWKSLLLVLVASFCACGLGQVESDYKVDAGSEPDGNPYRPDGQTIPDLEPSGEICGDGYDNDADGLVDEECNCPIGTTQGCFPGAPGSDRGACRKGSQDCQTVDGEFGRWTDCRDAVTPAVEICGDGIDNDCDGVDLACSVAVCSVEPPQVRPFETLNWKGEASYDPGDRQIVDYQWTILSFPAGSGAALMGSGANRTTQTDLSGSYIAQLVVVNDMGQPSQPCTATAIVQELEKPVALCSVDPAQAQSFEVLTWRGSQSHDPGGRPIVDHDWTVISFPPGSAADILGSGPDRTTQTDLAGSYTAQLVVTNDQGVSSLPCQVTAEVVPTENLWIEMFWTYAGDDMDLHLLAPSGVPRSSTDCYFMNCIRPYSHLDWGQSGILTDDPGLDLDDVPGTGPENINIVSPGPGHYTVFVHDYPGSMFSMNNEVTVRVYINGNPVAELTREISGEDSEWYVCTIDWPSGTVTPLP